MTQQLGFSRSSVWKSAWQCTEYPTKTSHKTGGRSTERERNTADAGTGWYCSALTNRVQTELPNCATNNVFILRLEVLSVLLQKIRSLMRCYAVSPLNRYRRFKRPYCFNPQTHAVQEERSVNIYQLTWRNIKEDLVLNCVSFLFAVFLSEYVWKYNKTGYERIT